MRMTFRLPVRIGGLLLVLLPLMGAPALANPGKVPLHTVPADHQPLAWMSEEESRHFPRYDTLEPAVGFWIRVFSEFSEQQSVIHWADHPEVVLEVLDFSSQARSMSRQALVRHRRKVEKQAKQRNDALLREIHAKRKQPDALSPHARDIYERFRHLRDDRRFLRAVGNLRAQRGLRERTRRALEIAGHYLPEMERTFARYGLPRLLTRLPVLESSFNVDAYSKVGAAGLWQFIPSSARIYMRYDEIADQRRDPWISTDAAARHLVDDYALLKNWPLALTAYNHGRAGIARGLRQTGGSTIEDLVQKYQSRRFGFASRNFYAEFLAVLEIDHHRDLYFGPVSPRKPIEFDIVRTGDFVEYTTLRQLSGTDAALFRRLNPAFSTEVVRNKILVPPDSVIRVPRGKGAAFQTGYAQLGADRKFSEQRRYFVTHRVRRGETVGTIARRYGVSQREIVSLNGLRNANRIRIGQKLKVPPRTGGKSTSRASIQSAGSPQRVETVLRSPHATASITPAKAGKAEHYLVHRVRRGQTLWQLARRYGTTVETLRRMNRLNKSSVLPVGMRLKVPPKGSTFAAQECKTTCS